MGESTDHGSEPLKLAQLPRSLTVRTRAVLVSAVLTPQLFPTLPTRRMIQVLEMAYRDSLWIRLKQMHCWAAAQAFIYNPGRHSAWGALVATHLLSLSRALTQGIPDRARRIWNAFPVRIQGPISLSIHLLRQLGLVPHQDFLFQDQDGKIIDLCQPTPLLRKTLTNALQRSYWQQAQDLRPHFSDISQLVTLVCDGLWTGPRLFHAQYQPTRGCSEQEQTPGHLFWDCPQWGVQRPVLDPPLQELVRDSAPSFHCGICMSHFPPSLKRQWQKLQQFSCRVIRGCEEHYETSSS